AASDAELRCAAAHALAWLPEAAKESVPALRAKLASADSDYEIAHMLLALGLIARNCDATSDLTYLDGYLGNESPTLVRRGAAIGLAGTPTRPGVLAVLINALFASEQLKLQAARVRFNEGNLVGYVSLVLAEQGSSNRTGVADAIGLALRTVNPFQSIDVT